MSSIKDPEELQRLYERRFARRINYRNRLWQCLCEGYFQRLVDPAGLSWTSAAVTGNSSTISAAGRSTPWT